MGRFVFWNVETKICNHLSWRTIFLIVGTRNYKLWPQVFMYFSANGMNDSIFARWACVSFAFYGTIRFYNSTIVCYVLHIQWLPSCHFEQLILSCSFSLRGTVLSKLDLKIHYAFRHVPDSTPRVMILPVHSTFPIIAHFSVPVWAGRFSPTPSYLRRSPVYGRSSSLPS